jgi:predicted nucleic acid-binding protein
LMPSDAAFVVLAEVLEVPLVTCDPRLGSATGHHARVEFFGVPG